MIPGTRPLKIKTYKAKIIRESGFIGGFNTFVLVSRVWRVFGTPFSIKNHDLKPFTTKKDAMRSAEKIAADFGIELKWEV